LRLLRQAVSTLIGYRPWWLESVLDWCLFLASQAANVLSFYHFCPCPCLIRDLGGVICILSSAYHYAVEIFQAIGRRVSPGKGHGGGITPHATIVRLHEHDNIRQTSNDISYNINQICVTLYSDELSTVILEAPAQLVSLTLHLLLFFSSAHRVTIAAGGALFLPADEKYGRSSWKVKSMQHLQTAQNRG